MPPRPDDNKWVTLPYPPAFKLGLRELAGLCEWEVREDDGVLRVASSERYRGSVPRLLRAHRVADGTNATDPRAYASFNSWERMDQWGSTEMRRLIQDLREVREPESPTDALTAFRLQFATMPDADVPRYLREFFESAISSLPRASLWRIDVSPALNWRIAAARILFSAREAPEVLNAAQQANSRTFPSPMGLMPSWGYGLNVFVESALMPASPWILGMNSYRRGGHAVVLFGRSEPGFRDRQFPETIDLLRARTLTKSRVPVARPEFESWLQWWVAKMNRLIAKAVDIGRYVTPAGHYDPGAQLGGMLSVERLLATTQELLADAGRAGFARVLMMFDVVDLLEGLNFGSWSTLLDADRAERQLSELESSLPGAIRDLVLTRCRRAVGSLAAFRDGFSLIQDRVTPDGQINIRSKDGKGMQPMSFSAAAQAYLRIARNASHSYQKMAQDPHDMSLLGAHLGDIPEDIADLAFLHTLRFIDKPTLPYLPGPPSPPV